MHPPVPTLGLQNGKRAVSSGGCNFARSRLPEPRVSPKITFQSDQFLDGADSISSPRALRTLADTRDKSKSSLKCPPWRISLNTHKRKLPATSATRINKCNTESERRLVITIASAGCYSLAVYFLSRKDSFGIHWIQPTSLATTNHCSGPEICSKPIPRGLGM